MALVIVLMIIAFRIVRIVLRYLVTGAQFEQSLQCLSIYPEWQVTNSQADIGLKRNRVAVQIEPLVSFGFFPFHFVFH